MMIDIISRVTIGELYSAWFGLVVGVTIYEIARVKLEKQKLKNRRIKK